MSSVNKSNCVRYYSTADKIDAEGLRSHCSELISAHWVRRYYCKNCSI
jgi:hypothetical protein